MADKLSLALGVKNIQLEHEEAWPPNEFKLLGKRISK